LKIIEKEKQRRIIHHNISIRFVLIEKKIEKQHDGKFCLKVRKTRTSHSRREKD